MFGFLLNFHILRKKQVHSLLQQLKTFHGIPWVRESDAHEDKGGALLPFVMTSAHPNWPATLSFLSQTRKHVSKANDYKFSPDTTSESVSESCLQKNHAGVCFKK